jgi:MoaA/NifB/PqqE/SkfB family radical SAM enzyme
MSRLKLYSSRLRTLTGAHGRREAMRLLRRLSGFERRLLSGRALAPYSVSFWVTDKCNLSCPMCWVKPAKSKNEDYLSAGEICGVISELAPFNPRIGLTGGEPLLRKDIAEIVSFASGKGLRVGLNTNGMLLGDCAEELVSAGLDTISISLDGPERVHDQLRGRPGSYRRALSGILALDNAKRNWRRRRPLVRVLATITEQNFREIPGLLSELHRLPLDSATVQHLWFTDRLILSAHQSLSRRVLGEESSTLADFLIEKLPPGDEVAEMLAQVKTGDWGLPVDIYPHLSSQEISTYYSEARKRIRRRCLSRWLRIDISPEGTVTPCLGYDAGNVRKMPFMDIWNGERMRRFRRVIGERGTLPGCSRCCGLFSD